MLAHSSTNAKFSPPSKSSMLARGGCPASWSCFSLEFVQGLAGLAADRGLMPDSTGASHPVGGFSKQFPKFARPAERVLWLRCFVTKVSVAALLGRLERGHAAIEDVAMVLLAPAARTLEPLVLGPNYLVPRPVAAFLDPRSAFLVLAAVHFALTLFAKIRITVHIQ
jgi:hypothetical protein